MGFEAKRPVNVPRVIVCDTGPLIHLSEAGAIHLLQQAGDVFAPPIIAVEFETNLPGWKLPQWVSIQTLDETAQQQVDDWKSKNLIDPGEAEAIALTLQIKPDWFLTDDAQARKFAGTLGLEVHGSIGLLLWSVATGHIKEYEKALTLLDNLAHSSLWVSDLVLREARQAIDVFFLDN